MLGKTLEWENHKGNLEAISLNECQAHCRLENDAWHIVINFHHALHDEFDNTPRAGSVRSAARPWRCRWAWGSYALWWGQWPVSLSEVCRVPVPQPPARSV